ncbi:MAG: hypothetical protein FWE22_08720 [Firmicutes bacterium]|nr:hypothetical protein [Bacillota bacterium]
MRLYKYDEMMKEIEPALVGDELYQAVRKELLSALNKNYPTSIEYSRIEELFVLYKRILLKAIDAYPKVQ